VAVTTTNDGWTAQYWFGSVSTLAEAGGAAEAELAEIDGEPTEEKWGKLPELHTVVNFEGGTLEAHNLDELREEIPGLERRDVTTVELSVSTVNYHALISASPLGVNVRVRGRRASVVHGLVTTLQRKLEPGVGRVRKQPLEPFPAENYVFLVVGWALGGGVGYLLARSFIDYGVDPVGAALAALVAVAPIMGTVLFFDRSRPSPPRLQLVLASEEDAPAPPPDDRGPILLARDWLKKHPLLALAGTLVVAIGANLVTQIIA
jgi:hypothetical protein